MKTCSKCATEKALADFNKDRQTSDGHKTWCRECCTAYRRDNPEKMKTFGRNWRAKNRLKYNKLLSDWRKKNPWVDRELKAKRRASIRGQTPVWLTKEQRKEIRDFYRHCPPGYEVDHIVPIQGKEASGLHVRWNLQYLTKTENLKKSNKLG